MGVIEEFKERQKASWAGFAVLENLTGTTAPRLVRFAGVRAGQDVLDVACGTGVVALAAARAGARARGLDLTPELLERARQNAALCGLDVGFDEADVEALPCPDATFDVVLSQFGHMFAPRPALALAEMLRVLRPGGTIAFSSWPPELDAEDPTRGAALRADLEAVAADYFADNVIAQDYLLTRARKPAA